VTFLINWKESFSDNKIKSGNYNINFLILINRTYKLSNHFHIIHKDFVPSIQSECPDWCDELVKALMEYVLKSKSPWWIHYQIRIAPQQLYNDIMRMCDSLTRATDSGTLSTRIYRVPTARTHIIYGDQPTRDVSMPGTNLERVTEFPEGQ